MEHWKTLKAHNGLQWLTLRAPTRKVTGFILNSWRRSRIYSYTKPAFSWKFHLWWILPFFIMLMWILQFDMLRHFSIFHEQKITLLLLTWLAYDNQDHKLDSYVPVNSGLKRLIAHTVDQRKRNKWNEFSMAKWIWVAANVAGGGMNVGLLSHSIG